MLFASSEAVLTIEDPNLHPMGKATAIFLLFTCLLGFLNGLDYASPEDGLVRPDEFVYRLALTAPDDTATFRGSVVDDEGQPMVNATVYLSWLDDATDVGFGENLTDDAGAFSFEKLDPGLIRVDIIVERDDHRDVFSNRVLLSPPALIEPIGFTTIDFTFPSSDTFAAQPCEREVGECEIRTVDRTPSQMDHPLMDPTAATGYVLVGFGFMGVALYRSRLRRMGAQIRFNRAFANLIRFGVFHHGPLLECVHLQFACVHSDLRHPSTQGAACSAVRRCVARIKRYPLLTHCCKGPACNYSSSWLVWTCSSITTESGSQLYNNSSYVVANSSNIVSDFMREQILQETKNSLMGEDSTKSQKYYLC